MSERGYVISRARRIDDQFTTVEIVRDDLQRVAVTIPYRYTTDDQVNEIIDRALAALDRPPKPVR